MQHTDIKHNIELLAPAANFDTGKAAINAGADAVYIGAPKFGARVTASNSIADISKLINYAHIFNAKVYAAVNTILFDNEIEEACSLIASLYNSGIDAVIIQDMGLLEIDLPPVPLFASTQTNNRTWEKVKFLESVGFQRVILARELNLSQIKQIRQSTNIDLEFFVHGALCVCYSGNCYLSYATGNRSANRGNCAQPCRLAYNLVNQENNILIKNKHLLSLKDLNLTNYLENLIDAGISSFKIEGRLKSIDYVTNITAWYRQKLDDIIDNKQLAKSSSGRIYFPFTPDPEKTFNRGFTEYYINQDYSKLASFDTPKSLGQFVGEVNQSYKEYFTIDSDKEFVNGDGICYISNNQELKGFYINKVDGNNIYPSENQSLKPGTKLYRNFDKKFNDLIINELPNRRISVNLILSETENGFEISAIDEDNNIANYSIESQKIIAENKDLANTLIINQLSKTGDTVFKVNKIEKKFKTDYFITSSVLNKIRREVLQLLEKERVNNYGNEKVKIQPNNYPFPEKSVTYITNIANQKSLEFYKRHGVNSIQMAFEVKKPEEKSILMTTKYCILREIGKCKRTNNQEFNQEMFLEKNQKKYRLIFDCKKCEMKIEEN